MAKHKWKIKALLLLVLLIALCAQSVQSVDTVQSSQVETSQEVAALVDRLKNADGHIPEDFTKEDMDKFLADADPEVVSEIMADLCENAEPIPMPIVDESTGMVQEPTETSRIFP